MSILSTYPGSSYKRLSGTSMATPVAASLVGLLLSNGDPQPLRTIVQSSDKIGTRKPGNRINVCRAIDMGTPYSCQASGAGG